MRVFEARDTNEMAPLVYKALLREGTECDSRNGPVLKFDSPVTFTYTAPQNRVNLDPFRDCNPFFHIMEGVMMLGNHNCVKCMGKFTGNMAQYSDNGRDFNAFYGSRMAEHHQFWQVANILRETPYTRQAVIDLWRPTDLHKKTKDKACNMMLVFSVRSGCLDMTIFNRSNDLIYGGVSGANIVHFSMIQEAMCTETGHPMGDMIHVVNDAHVYTKNPLYHKLRWIEDHDTPTCTISMEPKVVDDCELFCRGLHNNSVSGVYSTRFMAEVVIPMYHLWIDRKITTRGILDIKDRAWHNAVSGWLSRRDYEV